MLYVLGSSFFLLAWLLPVHHLPWAAAYQDFLAFLGLILLLLSTLRVSARLPLSSMLIFSVSFIPLAQYLAGKIFFFGDAFVPAIYLAAFGASVFVGFNLARQQTRREEGLLLASIVVVVGAVLSTWISALQWLGTAEAFWIQPAEGSTRPFGNLGQPNNLATLLCVGLAGVLYLFESRRLEGRAAGTLAAFILLGLALSQSRTPWVVAVVLICFHWLKSSQTSLRLKTGWIGVWIVWLASISFSLPIASNLLELGAGDLLTRESGAERLKIWSALIHAVGQQPISGFGWNQVSVAQSVVALDRPIPFVVEHSHNLILDLVVWNGVPLGLTIAGGFMGWIAVLAWRVRSTGGVCLLFCVIPLLVHAQLEFPLDYAFFLLPLGIVLGVLHAECIPERGVAVPRIALVAGSLAAVILFAVSWKEYRVLDEDYRLLRFETARIGTLKADWGAPDVMLFTQVREFIRFGRLTPSADMSNAELLLGEQMATRFPFPWVLLKQARIQEARGMSDDAAQTLMLLKQIHGDRMYIEAAERVAEDES